ncbi:hypothetical protein N7528_004326 [Penicillium herquei]|nr:hypothetical protein N7528_004326 [Penicillium herquei]
MGNPGLTLQIYVPIQASSRPKSLQSRVTPIPNISRPEGLPGRVAAASSRSRPDLLLSRKQK